MKWVGVWLGSGCVVVGAYGFNRNGFFADFWFSVPPTREIGRRASLGQEYVQPRELGPLGLWMLGNPRVV